MNNLANASLPSNGWAFFYANVDSITASKPLEVTIKLKQPDPVVQYLGAFGGGRIHQKANGVALGNTIGSPGKPPIGTGAYRIVDFSPDESVTFERNPHFWGQKPIFKRIVLKIIGADEYMKFHKSSSCFATVGPSRLETGD